MVYTFNKTMFGYAMLYFTLAAYLSDCVSIFRENYQLKDTLSDNVDKALEFRFADSLSPDVFLAWILPLVLINLA